MMVMNAGNGHCSNLVRRQVKRGEIPFLLAICKV